VQKGLENHSFLVLLSPFDPFDPFDPHFLLFTLTRAVVALPG